ncbi:MAG: hypothetical protein ACI841_000101 [Planctomycetota bacterium]|jgi:hypothetical protein
MGSDFINVKIDTDRHINGAAVAARLRGDRKGGIPWMIITSDTGAELITSDGPDGNCGCPVTPQEIEWFITMIQRSKRTLSGKALVGIRAELQAYAKTLGG